MAITLYGINNCDTVKKARKWLDNNVDKYTFVDFRKQPVTKARLNNWADIAGWETLLNRRSRSWRELDEKTRDNIGKNSAIALMYSCPTLIKRPVLESGNILLIGFDEKTYKKQL